MTAVISVSRHFELDHVGAKVRQHRRAMRAGQDAAQVQHANALQLLGKRGAAHGSFLVWGDFCRSRLAGDAGTPVGQANRHRRSAARSKPVPTGGRYLPVIIGRFSPCSFAQSIAIW
ncbi:hypothetical protein D3C76_1507870 [compost metagenome]